MVNACTSRISKANSTIERIRKRNEGKPKRAILFAGYWITRT
jgi:hypothetical protein